MRNDLRQRLRLRRFARSQSGAAAAELALIATVLVVALLNVADLSIYVFRRIQVEMAAQAGAQAVHRLCSPLQIPVSINCAGWTSAVATGVQSTSLGTAVSLQASSPTEGYYCVNSSNRLVFLSAVTNPSATDCSSYGSPEAPGDYVQVAVTYTYAPLFTSAPITVASLLTGPVTRTAWYRAG
jgi:Flp pilus assembly protein TadG